MCMPNHIGSLRGTPASLHIWKPENLLTFDPSDHHTNTECKQPVLASLLSTILVDSIYLAHDEI